MWTMGPAFCDISQRLKQTFLTYTVRSARTHTELNLHQEWCLREVKHQSGQPLVRFNLGFMLNTSCLTSKQSRWDQSNNGQLIILILINSSDSISHASLFHPWAMAANVFTRCFSSLSNNDDSSALSSSSQRQQQCDQTRALHRRLSYKWKDISVCIFPNLCCSEAASIF